MIVPIVPLFLNPLLVPAEIVPVFINDVMVEEELKLCKPNCASADIVPEFVIVPIIPLFCKPKSSAAEISPEFVNAVIVPVALLNSPRSVPADISPELVIVPIVPPFRNPSLSPAVIIPLFISSSTCPPAVRKLLFVVTEIVPLLVTVALVESPVETAVTVPAPSIVTPELIVTLEPSPPISKFEQLVVIVTVVPETAVQS